MSGGDGYLTNPLYREIAKLMTDAGITHRVEQGAKHFHVKFWSCGREMTQILHLGPNSKGSTYRKTIIRFRKIVAAEREWLGAQLEPDPVEQQTELALVQPEASTEPALTVRDGAVFADSRNVAAVFGREHRTVLAAVRDVACSDEFRRQNFLQSSYTNTQGKAQPCFSLTKDGFAFLVMGFTGANAARFKEAYISRFNEMEASLRQPAQAALSADHLSGLLGPIKNIVIKRAGDAVELGVQAIVAAIQETAQRQTEEHRHLFRQFREPASAVALHAARFLEVGAVYALAGIACAVPRRGKLSGDISRSLDSHCRRHGVIVRSAQIGGRDVSHWPREAVLEWLAASGNQMIERHMRAFAPRLSLVASNPQELSA